MPVKRCLHLNLDGASAEELLLTKGVPGSFLVRPSCSKPGDFTVSVRRPNGTVTHVKIRNTGDCFSLYGEEKFASMVELIQYYMESGSLKEKSGDVLLLKYPLPSTEPTTERWFHGYLSGPDAESMLKSRGRLGSFLVRESRTQPGSHVLVVKADDEKVVQVIIRTLRDQNSSTPLYDVGGGPKFPSLPELIDYYKQSAIIEETGSVLHLIQPFNATRIMANRVSDRIAELQRSVSSKGESGFWEEFKYIQEQDQGTLTRKEGQRPENRPKNRYKNILPYDHSRVKLTEHCTSPDSSPISSPEYYQSGSDYINANRIFDMEEPSPDRREYIAAQGCMGSTMGDFWRMIWQERCHIVIMITLEMERGKNKCIRYWPEDSSTPLEIDSMSGKFTILLVNHTELENFGIRTLNVNFKPANRGEEPRIVYQFYYKNWQDHSIPENPLDIIQFRDCINEKWAIFEPQPGPSLVHCSAGIGRTGTYIVIDILLEQIRKYGVDSEIDVQRTVLSCRQQRSGLVQTESQYKFIYSVVEAFVKRIKDEHDISQASTATSRSATTTGTTSTPAASTSSSSSNYPPPHLQQLVVSPTTGATSPPNDYVNFQAGNSAVNRMVAGSAASQQLQQTGRQLVSSSSHDYANTQPGGIVLGGEAPQLPPYAANFNSNRPPLNTSATSLTTSRGDNNNNNNNINRPFLSSSTAPSISDTNLSSAKNSSSLLTGRPQGQQHQIQTDLNSSEFL